MAGLSSPVAASSPLRPPSTAPAAAGPPSSPLLRPSSLASLVADPPFSPTLRAAASLHQAGWPQPCGFPSSGAASSARRSVRPPPSALTVPGEVAEDTPSMYAAASNRSAPIDHSVGRPALPPVPAPSPSPRALVASPSLRRKKLISRSLLWCNASNDHPFEDYLPGLNNCNTPPLLRGGTFDRDVAQLVG